MTNSNGTQTLESMSQAIWYNRWTLNKFKKYLSGEILEVGCGIGNFTKDLKKYGKVWAIDISDDYTRQTIERAGNTVSVGIGDIEKGEYFFDDKKFDSIVCLNVLEHIKDDQAALKNLYELLNEGGYLILLVPAFNFLYGELDKSIGHFRRYEKQHLKDFLEKIGFKIVSIKILNFLGTIGWYISSKIFKNRTVEERNIQLFNLFAPFFLSFETFIEPPIGTSILVLAKR